MLAVQVLGIPSQRHRALPRSSRQTHQRRVAVVEPEPAAAVPAAEQGRDWDRALQIPAL